MDERCGAKHNNISCSFGTSEVQIKMSTFSYLDLYKNHIYFKCKISVIDHDGAMLVRISQECSDVADCGIVQGDVM